MGDREEKRPEDGEIDPDAPASAEEIAASQRLRDALEDPSVAHDDADLARSLRAAWSPSTLDAGENRAILDATPSSDELAAAAALRDALDGREAMLGGAEGSADLAEALRCAFAPGEIDPAAHRAIVDGALAAMPERVPEKRGGAVVELAAKRRASLVRVGFGLVTGGLALAASIALVVTSPSRSETPLAKARTTQPLFSEPFKPGDTSARIDRIASARASDFRDNRFARWGVR
ncbi:MAG: hypothetical protein KF819_20325 [Labilithrix sp.]|nr:hypothetical protein [Labilithrix sp.]